MASTTFVEKLLPDCCLEYELAACSTSLFKRTQSPLLDNTPRTTGQPLFNVLSPRLETIKCPTFPLKSPVFASLRELDRGVIRPANKNKKRN